MTHDHPIEYVWLGIALFDFWASGSSWLAAHKDWARTRSEMKKLSLTALVERASRDAVTYIIDVSSLAGAFLAMLFASAATYALFAPPPPPPYTVARQSLVVISMLIVGNATHAGIALYGRLARYRLSHGYYEGQARKLAASKSAGQKIAETYEEKK